MTRSGGAVLAAGLMAVGCTNDYVGLSLGSALGGGGGGAGASSTTSGQGASSGSGGEGGSGAAASSSTGSAGGSIGGAGGGGGGTGGGAAPACAPGTVGDLVDDFGDRALAPTWDAWGGMVGDVDEKMGSVFLSPGGQAGSSRGFVSAGTYAFDSCSIHIEIVEPPKSSEEIGAYFELGADLDHFIRFGIAYGDVTYRIDDGSQNPSTSDTHDPIAHRWLRLRQEGQQVHFETSPDASSWTTMESLPAPSFLGAISVWVWTYTFAQTSNPDTVEVDNVNVIP